MCLRVIVLVRHGLSAVRASQLLDSLSNRVRKLLSRVVPVRVRQFSLNVFVHYFFSFLGLPVPPQTEQARILTEVSDDHETEPAPLHALHLLPALFKFRL
jgi:hypothetical protein